MTAGDEYFAEITARKADRDARAAFRKTVLDITRPGGSIFDFGAGPGIDAKFYAQQGLRVAAYDVDPRMCESFARHCREEIATRRVCLQEGLYRDFLAAAPPPPGEAADLITANFAPLSLVEEPRELFAKFHSLTRPNGRVLASVLNPYYLGDAKYGWWWGNAWRFMRRGHYSVPGGQAAIHRRSPGYYRRLAAPYFALASATRGLPGDRYRRGLPNGLLLASSPFVFLLFEKT